MVCCAVKDPATIGGAKFSKSKSTPSNKLAWAHWATLVPYSVPVVAANNEEVETVEPPEEEGREAGNELLEEDRLGLGYWTPPAETRTTAFLE